MTTDLKIKEGLYYSIKTVNTESDNISILTRHKDEIILLYNYSPNDCGDDISISSTYQQIKFTFHNLFLNTFSPDFDLAVFPASMQQEICCNTQIILHDIINCNFNDAFKNMFFESKALSLLLCFQKSNAQIQDGCTSCKFLTNQVEKDKIQKAKEIILTRLHNPPTIPELSLQIGINQCYLKKGFKEIFGSTIYDFVQEQRMSKAKMLLTTSQLSVSQVADKIGFSSTGNFSNAFKKFTGIYPSVVCHSPFSGRTEIISSANGTKSWKKERKLKAKINL